MSGHDDGRRYLKYFALIAALLLAAAVAFNALVDPYGVTKFVSLGKFNAAKPKEWENARIAKPFEVARRHYDAIVLGTSQVERGIDPGYPALSARGIALYNMGLSELRLYETRLLLDYSFKTSGIGAAVISLDFGRYNRPPEDPTTALPEDWDKGRLFRDYLRTLISQRSVADSFITLRTNRAGSATLEHLPNGVLNVDQFFAKAGYPDVRGTFDSVDAVYINSAYDRMLAARPALLQSGFDHTALRRILALARERHIELHFFIPPVHAREMEIIEYLGLAPLFHRWKAELACLFEAESASSPGRAAYPLWDFSGYNSITTEPVPAKGDTGARMKWFYDPIHFTPRAGNIILGRIFQLDDPALAPFGDFGVRVTPGTLRAQIDAAREARRRYLERHPEISATVAALRVGPRPVESPSAGSAPAFDCGR